MPLPSKLTYNDLDGEEIKHILLKRVATLLEEVPYLQRHLTMPRVRMEIAIDLISYADQEQNEHRSIKNSLEVENLIELRDAVDASRRGQPPDKVRDEHELPIPTPARGPMAVEDGREPLTVKIPPDGKRMTMATGSIVDRTGSAPEREGATVVVQDVGPAGLARGAFERGAPDFRNSNRRDGAPVARPNLPTRD